MTAARHSATKDDFYAAYDQYQSAANFDVVPEERIGQPLARRAGWTLLKLTLLVLIALGGTWVVRDNPALWQTIREEISRLQIAAASPNPDAKPTDTPLPKPASPAGASLVPEGSATAQPEPPSPPPAPPEQAVAAPPPPTPAASSPPAPAPADAATKGTAYTAPPAQPVDPNRKKAETAGLHPDISPALLAHLTTADFRNARRAIDTALAETADDAVYIWPRKRAKGLAMFKVHFVPGAGRNCRRYIVTIAKDGWLTTALPMERCGVIRRTAKVSSR